MDTQAIVTLVLVGGAVLALCWVLFSTVGISGDETQPGEVNFARLPWVFKMTWGAAAVLDASVGAALAAAFPKKARKLDRQAVTAALPLDAKRVFAAAVTLSFIMGMVGVAIALALGGVMPHHKYCPFIAAPLFVLLGWFWPGMNLRGYAWRRQEKIVREMPFAIDLIGGAIRSGLDFGAAVRYYVSLKTGSPLEEEFAHVLTDVSLSVSFDKAIEAMAGRVRVESVASFAGVVSYSMEIGSPMSQALKSQGADLRRARFALAERKAHRAPAVMIFPLVVFIMPAVFIVVLTPMFVRLSSAFGR